MARRPGVSTRISRTLASAPSIAIAPQIVAAEKRLQDEALRLRDRSWLVSAFRFFLSFAGSTGRAGERRNGDIERGSQRPYVGVILLHSLDYSLHERRSPTGGPLGGRRGGIGKGSLAATIICQVNKPMTPRRDNAPIIRLSQWLGALNSRANTIVKSRTTIAVV